MRFELSLDGKTYKVELDIGAGVRVKVGEEMYRGEVRKNERGLEVVLNGEGSEVVLRGEHVSVDGRVHDVEISNFCRGRPSWTHIDKGGDDPDMQEPGKGITPGEGLVYPPMPGRVVTLNVEKGDRVGKGSPLLVLEAMKMQNEVVSEYEGVVREVRISEGDLVEARNVLMVIGK